MQEIAIYFGVVAWLACWDIDLVVAIVRGPVMIETLLKFVIVTVCLIIVLHGGRTHNWMWGA